MNGEPCIAWPTKSGQTTLMESPRLPGKGPSLSTKMWKEQSCISSPKKAGPCLLSVALLFILAALISLFYRSYGNDSIVYDGDTVIVYNGSQMWPTAWIAMLGPSSNPVDVYKVQASDLKEYRQLKTYHQDETFYPNQNYSVAMIEGVYLVQGTTLQYDITVHSGNLTTADGQLLVFTTRYEYEAYITGYVLAARYAVSTLNFSIGADNRPIRTRLSVTSNSTSYYYFTCMVPGNTTFFSSALYTMVFYNHSDYSDKVAALEKQYDGKIFYLPPMKEPVVLLAYSHPNGAGGRHSITLSLSYRRLLPTPSVLVTIFGVILTLYIVAMLLYYYSM